MFLSLTNIKKSFGQGDSRVEVLKGIDLSIEKGEFGVHCVEVYETPNNCAVYEEE